MNSCVNSVLWRISWNHGWILGNEFTYEIMVEFIKYSRFSSKFVSVGENVLLIQSNHHSFFAVSSLQALRLLRGRCSVATRRRCCDGKRRVMRTAEQGGRGGPCKHMMDVTVVEISWACLSASNLQVERLSRAQPHWHNPEGAIRSSKGFQADDSNTRHNS